MRGGPLWLLVAALTAVGCAHAPAPRASVPLSRDRDGVRSRAPEPEPDYLGEGLASFYGPGLYGHKTANGERLERGTMTAAHRTLRFGTCVRVVNLANGKSVRVRVNDRGPYVGSRIMDVSEAAAHRLGMTDRGVARVRLYLCGAPGVSAAETAGAEELALVWMEPGEEWTAWH